jgi:hypothetical protein
MQTGLEQKTFCHYIPLHCGFADVNAMSAMYILLTLLHWLCLCTWRAVKADVGMPALVPPPPAYCHQPAPSLGSSENPAAGTWICYSTQSLPAAAAGTCCASWPMPVGKDDCKLPEHRLLTRVLQSEAHSEVCHVCYMHPPDGRPLGNWELVMVHLWCRTGELPSWPLLCERLGFLTFNTHPLWRMYSGC